jgi:hypothetical protein
MFLLFAPRFSGLDWRGAAALIGLMVIHPALGEHFAFAQSQILVLLMLALMLRLMQNGYDVAAGIVLAIVGSLRVYPVLLLGYLFMKGRWPITRSAILGGIAISAITFGIYGKDVFFGLLESAHYILGVQGPHFSKLFFNLAVGSFVSRMYWYAFGVNLSMTLNLARVLTIGLVDAIVLAMTVVGTRRSEGDRAFPLWIISAIILSPIPWIHYMVLTMILYAMMGSAAVRGECGPRAIWTGVASYLLIAFSIHIRTPLMNSEHIILLRIAAESLFVSLMLAFLSAWWFAIDSNGGHGRLPASLASATS